MGLLGVCIRYAAPSASRLRRSVARVEPRVRGPCIELACRHVTVGVLVWKMVPPAATRRLVGWAHTG